MEKIEYPIRINRYLAIMNFCSRREADVLIEKGVVRINGKLAKLGDKVNETDKVEVDVKKKGKLKQNAYYAYNKPRGIVTHSPEPGQKSIEDVSKLGEDFFPVGRLDRSSRGLIILTNDGRVTGKLLDPNKDHEKEYIVRVNKNITESFLRKLQAGVKLEDFRTKPCFARKINPATLNIILTEGKNHQIRRMCAALGYDVLDLERVRVLNINLGDLKAGEMRRIEGQELVEFMRTLEKNA